MIDSALPAKQIGARIRSARLGASLSQAALGVKIGVQQPTVANWESGRRTIGIAELLAVADVLGVPVGVLLGRPDGNAVDAESAAWRAGFEACAAKVRGVIETGGVR